MKFHEFLESQYVQTNIHVQQTYSPYLQARTQAIQGLINFERRLFRWLSYPIVLVEYALVLCGFKAAPPTAQELVKLNQKTNSVHE